jgi:hypothetical protein
MEKMKRYTWARSARRHEAVFLRALGVQHDSSVAAVEETPYENERLPGKVASN